MRPSNPFTDAGTRLPSDEQLAELGAAGDSDALAELVRRHQRWIYNLALRMLQSHADAEDATQESLIRIVTRLSTFRGDSEFRTWAYRIALHHVLDRKRSRPEEAVHGFDCFGGYLSRAPDEQLAQLGGASGTTALPEEPTHSSAEHAAPDTQMLIEEAKLSCLMGMLLCLDREQRIVFVLGEIFEVTDAVASDVLNLSRDAFRQKLSRARTQLENFMQERCGLVDPNNPCRCSKKTRAFIRDGIVDPARLVFYRSQTLRVKDVCKRQAPSFGAAVETAQASLFREQPFYEGPDLVSRIRDALANQSLQSMLELS